MLRIIGCIYIKVHKSHQRFSTDYVLHFAFSVETMGTTLSVEAKDNNGKYKAGIICMYWYRTIMNDTSISVDDIGNIIIKYYLITEYFDILCPDFIADEDGTVLKRIANNNWINSNYGKNIIPSIGDYIYEWYFKINKLDHGYAFIGICDSDCSITSDSAKWVAKHRYMYYGHVGRIIRDGDRINGALKYKTDDVIVIRLNTKEGKIEFYKVMNEDGEKQLSGKCEVKQDEALSYKLAATLYYDQACVTLTKFDVCKV